MREPLCGVVWTLLFVALAIAAGAGLWWLVTWVEKSRSGHAIVCTFAEDADA
jgi:hypothetical protein